MLKEELNMLQKLLILRLKFLQKFNNKIRQLYLMIIMKQLKKI